jgi:hypothetical protein
MRRLTEQEKAVVVAMVRGSSAEREILSMVDETIVQEMEDGGMGSLRFVRLTQSQPRFGRQLREASYRDDDGVSVSITVNLDQDGFLFELDVFKADSSPLRRFPRVSELEIK